MFCQVLSSLLTNLIIHTQHTYLQALIEKKEIQRKRPRSEEPKKREFTFIYYIKLDEVKKKCARKHFVVSMEFL